MTNKPTGQPDAGDLQLCFPEHPIPDAAYAGVHLADEGTDAWARALLDQAVDALAQTHRPFTTDNLPPEARPEDRPNQVGAAVRRAYLAGRIKPTGAARPSTNPSRRGGLLREWVGAEAAAA